MSESFKTAVAVGQRLKRFREAADLSQSDVGQSTDISQPTYSRIENGERGLRGDEALQLAELFGVRLGAILGRGEVERRVQWSCRNDGDTDMALLRQVLDDYMELNTYLDMVGIE